MARYQYETSPRKVKPNYEQNRKKAKKTTINKKNEQKEIKRKKAKERLKMIIMVIIGFSAFFAIVYRNAIIETKHAKVQTLKSDLAIIKKENEQLEANVESSLNLKAVQEEAEKQMGMKALSSDQIEYINLPKNDYVEASVSTEEVSQNYLQKICKFVKKLIK